MVNGPISLAAYARHRGVKPPTVTKALKRGRLKLSVVYVDGRPMISDAALADEEWRRNTSYVKRPDYERAGDDDAPHVFEPTPITRLSVFRAAGLVVVTNTSPDVDALEDAVDLDEPGVVVAALSPADAITLSRALVATATQTGDDVQ